MSAGVYDITIEQGATFALTLTWLDTDGVTPINLTGYTARMKIKKSVGGTEIASLTNASGITLGGVAGTIAILIADTATAAYTFKRAVYDLELVNGSTVTRLIEGNVILSREVTV